MVAIHHCVVKINNGIDKFSAKFNRVPKNVNDLSKSNLITCALHAVVPSMISLAISYNWRVK